jgi:NAD-dependent SIR2 family protein deacetylase
MGRYTKLIRPGTMFEQLEVVKLVRVDRKQGSMYRVRCVHCGQEKVVRAAKLRNGEAVSCAECLRPGRPWY